MLFKGSQGSSVTRHPCSAEQGNFYRCARKSVFKPGYRSETLTIISRGRTLRVCCLVAVDKVDGDTAAHSSSAPEGTASSQACLLQKWDQVINSLRQVVEERHSHNRKGRIAGLRQQMLEIQSQLPADVAQQLEQQLIDSRSAESRARKQRLEKVYETGPHVVVDCSFAADHCRPGLETRSLAKQVEWALAVNRQSRAPVALHATDWHGPVRTFGEHIGSKSWPCKLHEQPLLAVFKDHKKIIVLSPDATEPLQQIEHDAVYVIGGIVDRTIAKGVTAGFAESRQLRSMRLPIPEHAQQLGLDQPGVRINPVLNVSDVAIALIDFQERGDWVAALDKVIPLRKRRPVAPKPKKARAKNLAPSGHSSAASSSSEDSVRAAATSAAATSQVVGEEGVQHSPARTNSTCTLEQSQSMLVQ